MQSKDRQNNEKISNNKIVKINQSTIKYCQNMKQNKRKVVTTTKHKTS